MFAAAPSEAMQFAQAVRAGLSKKQKELPSTYLYDAVGSALFDAITLLPEYGLTRADARLIEEHAREMLEVARMPRVIAELGSGSGAKTCAVLRELPSTTRYYPIDVSQTALDACARTIQGLAEVSPVQASYIDGLQRVAEERRPGERMLVLFLGSTIGNFERPCAIDFLRAIGNLLRPGDSLLLGTDLVKPVARMIQAYDDPTGVTASFNLNILARINRELGGDFDLRQFAHQARYNRRTRAIEMHLVSQARQSVHIAAADFTCRFRKGESIWTEASHKFREDELDDLAHQAGFDPTARWIDREWPFAESIFRALQ